MEIRCLLQREQTKTAGPLNRRYETHVYCRSCQTYWLRDPERKGKRQFCPCCKSTCRERPTHGDNGAAKYARNKEAIKARREPTKIKNSIKSEVRNMVHNAFPDIVIPCDSELQLIKE